MNDRDLVGMRDGDLKPDERRRRDALLRDDEVARQDADLAQALMGALPSELDGGPSIEEVRSAARPVQWRIGPWVASLAAAAAAVWMVLPGAPSVRDRGVGAVPLSVRLSAVAEGASGVRPLAPGASVGPDERVVFWVDASGPGGIRIVEDQSVTVYPSAGSTWQAVTGAQATGGDQPVSYRPSALGSHRYQVSLCDQALRCVHHTLALEWSP